MAALALHLEAVTRQASDSGEPLVSADWSMRPGTYIGPFVVGWSFDVLLFGVIFHQVIIWSSHFQAERLVTKLLVIWTSLVSFGVTVFIIREIWDKFVLNYGVYTPFAEPRVHATYLMLDSAVIVPVQLFYVARASRLTRKKLWLVAPVVLLAAVSLVGTIGGTVTAVRLEAQLGWSKKLDKWLYILLSSMTAANLLISVLSTYGLIKSQTAWRDNDHVAERVIRVGAETFFGPTILALASFLHLVTHSGSLMNVFFECVLGKLHVVSLLALLNSRYSMKQMSDESGVQSRQRAVQSFVLSARKQQRTVDLHQIQVEVITHQTAHNASPLPLGLNRQRFPDEDSERSSKVHKEDIDEYSSSTKLNREDHIVLG